MNGKSGSGDQLTVGEIVAIGLALAFACIVLTIWCGILIERWRLQRDGYHMVSMDKSTGLARKPPFIPADTRRRDESEPTAAVATNGPDGRKDGSVANSSVRISIRSATSFYTDSSSRDSGSGRLFSRPFSTWSARSSNSTWLDFSSRSSNSDFPSWQLDQREAAARLRALYGVELQLMPQNRTGSLPYMARVEEERFSGVDAILEE